MTRLKALAGVGAFLALGLACGPVAAQSAVPPPPVRGPAPSQAMVDAQAEDVADWLTRVTAWGGAYNTIVSRRNATLLWLLEEPDHLLELLDAGDKPGARAWVSTWATQARRRLEAETAALSSLPVEAPELPASISLTPAHEARVQVLTGAPARVSALLASTGEASESYIQLVEAAASGDEHALLQLDKGVTTLIAAQLEAENVMLAGAYSDPTSLNYHFAAAMIATNNGLIVLMRHQQAVALGQAPDPAISAAQLRTHAGEGRAAVGRMRASIDDYERLIRSDPAFSATELAGVFGQIFESLRASAAVEARFANELEALAAAVASDDRNGLEASADRIAGLTDERIALDADRRRLLAANGG